MGFDRPRTGTGPLSGAGGLLLIVLACAACNADFTLPSGARVTCKTEPDCPEGLRCQVSLNRCVTEEEFDVEPPVLVSASAPSAGQVVIVFSEPMADGVADPAHYHLEPELAVTDAVLSSNRLRVTLFTKPQWAGEPYTVTVTNVADLAANPLPDTGTPAPNRIGFDGFGERDTTPPDLVWPREAVLARPMMVVLTWAARAGARGYTVQVATDPGFTNLLVDHALESAETSLALPDATRGLPALDQPVTYYWRVRANVTASPFGEGYPSGRFDVLQDAVFVHCPEGDTCEDGDAVGSRTRPFARIQSGIGAAIVHGADKVLVAARKDKAPYTEQVLLSDGIALSGGYDPAFVTRDVLAHETIIQNDALAVVSAANLSEASIEGFTIQGTGNEVPVNYGVDVSNVGRFTMRECKVRPRKATERAVGVNLTGCGDQTLGGGVLLEDCVIESGVAGSYAVGHSNGVRLDHSSATLRHNVIRAASVVPHTGAPFGEFHSAALRNTDSQVLLDRNRLTSGPVTAPECSKDDVSCASWAVFAYMGRMELTSNVIVANASENTMGVVVTDHGYAHYVNNTIAVDVAGKRSTALNQDGEAPLVINNLFIALGTPDTEDTSIQDIRNGFTCQNNVFVNYLCSYSETPYGPTECQTPDSAGSFCKAADGNLMLGSATAAVPTDLRPDDGTHVSILGGGRETTRAATDLDGAPRTCDGPGDCWSVGAFEVEQP